MSASPAEALAEIYFFTFMFWGSLLARFGFFHPQTSGFDYSRIVSDLILSGKCARHVGLPILPSISDVCAS